MIKCNLIRRSVAFCKILPRFRTVVASFRNQTSRGAKICCEQWIIHWTIGRIVNDKRTAVWWWSDRRWWTSLWLARPGTAPPSLSITRTLRGWVRSIHRKTVANLVSPEASLLASCASVSSLWRELTLSASLEVVSGVQILDNRPPLGALVLPRTRRW